jgi:hypothetical protein
MVNTEKSAYLETLLATNLTNIECLKKIYNLDLKFVLNNVLNKENFIDYYSIVADILNILVEEKQNSNSDPIQTNHVVEVNCDKILEFCLNHMHIQLKNLNDQYHISFDLTSNDTSTLPSSPLSDILLKYFRLCIPNSSAQMQFCLFQLYLIYFAKMINNKYEYLNVGIKNSLQDLLGINCQEIHSFIGSATSTSEFNLKQSNFLASFFSLVLNESSKFFSGKNEKLTEFLIGYILNILYGLNDNDLSIITMCVNFLSKLATSSNLKRTVLQKCFSKLETMFAEAIYSSSHDFNENKNRLDAFKQDINLTLLVALSDYIMEFQIDSFNESYLRKTEFWSLVQLGLYHTNLLTRKQALYLVKRTTDLAQTHKMAISSLYYDSFLTETDIKEKKIVPFYDAKNPIWNDYFLCIELLEETSVR